jgi:hypothetical protein
MALASVDTVAGDMVAIGDLAVITVECDAATCAFLTHALLP